MNLRMASRPYSFSIVIRAEYCAMVSERSVAPCMFAPTYLMSPPLVSHLVTNDVEDEINVIGVLQIENESDGLGVRHGSRKRLGKARNPRKLDDPRLFVRIRSEIQGVIGERLFHRVQHFGNVPGMLLQVVHLDADPVPVAARH